MPAPGNEPPFDCCPHGIPWNECDDCTAEWDVLDLAEFPEWGGDPGDHMRWDYVGPLPPLPPVVPCQPCLGLGRYWDDAGLTVLVCSACNGSGTDEEYADDE